MTAFFSPVTATIGNPAQAGINVSVTVTITDDTNGDAVVGGPVTFGPVATDASGLANFTPIDSLSVPFTQSNSQTYTGRFTFSAAGYPDCTTTASISSRGPVFSTCTVLDNDQSGSNPNTLFMRPASAQLDTTLAGVAVSLSISITDDDNGDAVVGGPMTYGPVATNAAGLADFVAANSGDSLQIDHSVSSSINYTIRYTFSATGVSDCSDIWRYTL